MVTKHRHTGPKVRYRTKKGKIAYRKRPIHSKTTMKKNKNKPYSQLKREFALSAYGDDDNDGVVNKKDCRPWDKKRHMVWDIDRAKQEAHKIEYMSPSEYLERTDTDPEEMPEFFETYGDTEKEESRPIAELGEYIQSEDTKVGIPYVGSSPHEHEGRHRAYAAGLISEEEIPVAVPLTGSERDDIAEEWIERTLEGHGEDYKNQWRDRFKREFPEHLMGPKFREKYREILGESGYYEAD